MCKHDLWRISIVLENISLLHMNDQKIIITRRWCSGTISIDERWTVIKVEFGVCICIKTTCSCLDLMPHQRNWNSLIMPSLPMYAIIIHYLNTWKIKTIAVRNRATNSTAEMWLIEKQCHFRINSMYIFCRLPLIVWNAIR